MSVFEQLAPVFAQILLTFALLGWMRALRYRASATRTVRVRDIALGQPAWPARATQIDRAFHNQLELPILYYVLVTLILVTHTADWPLSALSWAFVASRYAHAFVHTTSNVVPRRFALFVVGATLLVIMWAIFALRISWVY